MPHPARAPWTWTLLGTGALALWGGHPEEAQRALEALARGNGAKALAVFRAQAEKDGDRNQLLALLELGALHRLQGDFAASAASLDRADLLVRQRDQSAVLSAGRTLRGAGAVLTNDALLAYESPSSEKILARTLNALNYALLGDLEKALVEIRKAEEYQKLARPWEEGPLAGDQEDPRASAILAEKGSRQALADLEAQAGKVKDSRENPFTSFLASQLYLAQGAEGWNDAWVAAQRAFQLAPHHGAVRRAFGDAAGRMGRDVLAEAQGRLGLDGSVTDPKGARAIVIYEGGRAPARQGFKLSFLVEHRPIVAALPFYRAASPAVPPLRLEGGEAPVETAPLMETGPMAARALRERMPGIIVRQVLGAWAKAEATQQAGEKLGPLGGLLAFAFAETVTKADLRSWLCLPGEIQVAWVDLKPDQDTLTLRGPAFAETVKVDPRPGAITLVSVRALDTRRTISCRTFRHAPAPPQPGAFPTGGPS